MSFRIKEIFYTLQGEGRNSGRAAVFCRFAGCNLWSGYEKDRLSAQCQFCDTDFVGTDGAGGGSFASAGRLADAIAQAWAGRETCRAGRPLVVLTGGEPLLQLDAALIEAIHARGFEIAVETNGTLPVPDGVDWVCVSPKAGADLVVTHGDELKLIYPQAGAEPEQYRHLDFRFFYLQPMDGPNVDANTRAAVDYCLNHPGWQLSLQTHKLLGLR